jgi:hypothetical protein
MKIHVTLFSMDENSVPMSCPDDGHLEKEGVEGQWIPRW